MGDALISVGLPFYRDSHLLVAAVRSIFAQVYQNWELILACDGPNEKCSEVANAISDPRVRVIGDGKRRGLVYRLNEIAIHARGQLIARMDADDVMHPRRLAVQAELLAAMPEVDLVGTASYIIGSDNRVLGVRAITRPSIDPRSVVRRGFLLHATVIGRSDWFRRNPYSMSFPRAEDHELWCRTCRSSRFEHIPYPLYYYRETPGARCKYVASCRTDRLIYRTYGRALVGALPTIGLIAESHLKAAIYTIAAAAGCETFLQRRRNELLPDDLRTEGVRGLQFIMSTPVPGLDTGAPSS